MAKCVVCKTKFKPKFNSLQRTCDIPCAIVDAREQQEKKRKQETKANRKELKEYREKNRSKPQWIKITQPVFNKWVRMRDFDQPCISCGRYDHQIDDVFRGGKWDCGHFLTVGAHDELRFEPLNAHKQCKSCNGGSGKYTKKNHTVGIEYRERLIFRIGQDKVDWLEGPHEIPNRTIEEIKEIRIKYGALALDLEKQLR